MSILSWDTPAKARSSKEHTTMYSSDSGVPGTYVPNMDEADMAKWKAKLVGARSDHPRVEIRKSIGGVQLLVIVCADPAPYPVSGDWKAVDVWRRSGTACNVSMSMNGTLRMGFGDWAEFDQAISEAHQALVKEHP